MQANSLEAESSYPSGGITITESPTPRGESDLLVFISSVMTDELKPARHNVVQAVRAFPVNRPWAFEFTPASSKPPAEEYLGKVAEADFVIWLVGSETTQPVVDEIATCVSAGRRLLAFKLPSESRDEQTQRLIEYVSEHTKWKDVSDVAELSEQINAALLDEFVRALRDPAPPTRRTKLCEAHRLSTSRCRQAWIALSVPDELAAELSEDQSVGDVLAAPNPGLHMVTGDQGSGKSLALERLFQRLVKDALADSSRPFPLFVNARDLREPLSDYVDRMYQGYAQRSSQGAAILIDGLDEIGVMAANELLRQASAYIDANANATAVVTSRLLPGLSQAGKQIAIPTLDDESVTSLVNRISGCTFDMRFRYDWSDSAWDAAKRPLFAVMIGAELRTNPGSGAPRPSELVDRLAQRLRQEAGNNAEETDELLQALAVKAINSGSRVLLSDVSPRLAKQSIVVNSRLVTQQENAVDFTLAIFREWYAARALIEQTVSVDEILSASDRWIIPLEIVLDSDSLDLRRSVMLKLASSDPGLASLLLRRTEPYWPDRDLDPPSLGTAMDVGGEIQKAMDVWRQGLGKLYSVVGPVDGDGNTAPLGIRLNGDWVTMSWYSGSRDLPAVMELPSNIGWNQIDPDWPTLSGTRIPRSELWPWMLTKHKLAGHLSEAVDSRFLALNSLDAIRELTWTLACAIRNQGEINPRPIEARDIIRTIREVNIRRYASYALSTGGHMFSDKEILLVEQYLEDLVANGEEFIADPWPSADQLRRSGWIWENYSPQQLLTRTIAVYAGALRIYKDLTDRWFNAFAIRLRLSQLLPARLEGVLMLPSRDDRDPVLTWCTRCLPYGSESTVEFSLGDEREFRDVRDFWRHEGSKLEQLRTRNGAVPSPIHSSQLLPVWKSRPATELAHEWLADELRELGWDRF